MKNNLKQGWANEEFWRIRNKLAADTNKNKNEVVESIGRYCEKNYEDLVNHILNNRKVKETKYRFELKF